MSVPFNLILIFNSYSMFLIKHLVFRWIELKGFLLYKVFCFLSCYQLFLLQVCTYFNWSTARYTILCPSLIFWSYNIPRAETGCHLVI